MAGATECEYILVMGATGAGKTSFINSVSNSNFTVGHSLTSCTYGINPTEPFRMEGHNVVLFDTPGFDDTNRTDIEILTDIAIFLGDFHKSNKKLFGVIYLHDISKTRVGGSAIHNIKMFNSVVGDTAAKNVVIVTTKWDLVESSVANQRHAELAEDMNFFGTILKGGATMEKYKQGDSPLGIIQPILKKHKHVTLQIQAEMANGKDVAETTAAGILNREKEKALKEAEERHKKEMDNLEESIQRNAEALSSLKASAEAEKRRIEELEAEYQRQLQMASMDKEKDNGCRII